MRWGEHVRNVEDRDYYFIAQHVGRGFVRSVADSALGIKVVSMDLKGDIAGIQIVRRS